MPRSFDLSADYKDSVEEVHRAFPEERYWHARLADIPVDDAKLESMRVGGEFGDEGTRGASRWSHLQVVRSHNLHAVVKQLHRGDLCIRRRGDLGTGRRRRRERPPSRARSSDAPVHVSGTAELSPIAESGGARLAFQITVQVRVPLIGGKVERIIGTQLAELVSREQQFTTEWITNNAGRRA